MKKSSGFTGPALLWKRIVAFLIDILILALFVFIPFRGVFAGSMKSSFSESLKSIASNEQLISGFRPYYIAMSLLAFLYFFIMESKMSQTIGKKIMNLHVAGETKDLKKWQVFVRSLLFIPIFPFDLLVIIDPLFMFFRSSNQRLSEILSKTRVVEKYTVTKNFDLEGD